MARHVVIDLNVLEGKIEEFVEPDDQLVLPHVIFAEIVGAYQSKRVSRFKKHLDVFQHWYRSHRENIWVACEWGVIADREVSIGHPIAANEWRDEEFSLKLRASAQESADQWGWRILAADCSQTLRDFDDRKHAFLEGCDHFKTYLTEHEPSAVLLLKQSAENAMQGVREPFCGTFWTPNQAPYNSPDWIKELRRWPSTLAVGRMSRIACWYGQKLAMGQTKDFANNYEDGLYGFTASYTGYLATEDENLRQMVKAVFGDRVTVLVKKPK